MTDFVAYTSRWRIALLILIVVMFVMLGMWMSGILGPSATSRRYPQALVVIIGWFSVLFGGFCAVLWTKRLFGPQDQLKIGNSGIRWKPWSEQTIPWFDVKSVSTWTLNRQSIIVLHLRDRSRLPGKGLLGASARANRLLTGGDISISLTGTDRSFDEAITAIEQFRATSASHQITTR